MRYGAALDMGTAVHTRAPKLPSKLPPLEPTDDACNGRIAGGTDPSKGYCKQAPGWGTQHPGIGRCKRHGGSTPLYQEHVEALRAKKSAETFALPRHIDPHTALEEELDRTAGLVDWYTVRVRDLKDAQLEGPVGGGQGAYPEHKLSVWINALADERVRFRQVAKACIDAGIAQRRVEIAEQQGQLIAICIKGILQALGVLDHPEAPKIVREHLLQLHQTREGELVDAA